jgi:diaminohydroxyphosphoribosylaminopyrimidine deaminase/5-amino-6-(5-phosphoribosylamino)uracil reductase
MADDPMLNVRYAQLNLSEQILNPKALRQPLRVIIDGRNQLPSYLKCLQPIENDSAGALLIVNSKVTEYQGGEHVSQWQAPSNGNKLELEAVLQKLGQMQVNNLWVEAGAKLAGALLENNLIDELILYQAPKLIGSSGRDLFDIAALDSMDQLVKLTWSDVRLVGQDVKMTALLGHQADTLTIKSN